MSPVLERSRIFHSPGGAIPGARPDDGVAEIADVCGVEDSGIVLADVASSTAAEKIVDLAVGEGEMASRSRT